jgi:hypothetical protein
MRPERVQAEMSPGHDRVDHPLADHDGGRDGTRCGPGGRTRRRVAGDFGKEQGVGCGSCLDTKRDGAIMG